MWVIPLSLYLLSFIICFDNERWYVRKLFGAAHDPVDLWLTAVHNYSEVDEALESMQTRPASLVLRREVKRAVH